MFTSSNAECDRLENGHTLISTGSSGNLLEINENEIYINNTLEIDIEKGIFIYGKYVNNFLTIDINQITSVNTNVIRHLVSRIEDLEEIIKYIGKSKGGN